MRFFHKIPKRVLSSNFALRMELLLSSQYFYGFDILLACHNPVLNMP